MRGKAKSAAYCFGVRGITPAYAGKRQRFNAATSGTEDHPRLCGEKLSGRYATIATTGSPPPMRGKAPTLYQAVKKSRITPAYAGKRLSRPHRGHEMRDHPRLCGEKGSDSNTGRSNAGSPPPMRGKEWRKLKKCSVERITPAYAGKSADRQVVIVRQRDHPRLCGEKFRTV